MCSNVPGSRASGPQACGRALRPARRADSGARPAGVMIGGRRSAHAWVIALTVLTATAALTSACGGNSMAGALQARLLSASDLPDGWSAAPANPKTVQTSAPCLSGPLANSAGFTYAAAGFVQGTVIPTLGEVLATGPQAKPRWRSLSRALAHCRTATITIAGTKAPVIITPLSFPRSATTTAAYAWTFTIAGIDITDDLVLFEAGQDTGYLSYSDLGRPAFATVQAFLAAAVAKAQTGTTARIPDEVSIASAPVRIAHTKLGAVAYRAAGSGPPLVLITGYGATMESWDRSFVDTLAERYHVVIFDNAGNGQTLAMPAPLSIDAMARQTSALISALGLQRPDVLGWSMGSMIAQALAVLDSHQVRRLVLCASWPGNGAAIRPSQTAISAFNGGNSQRVMSVLFPPGQAAAQNTYLASTSSYPAAPAAPSGTVTAQGHAVDQWWAGTDPAGRQPATITAPTLIADGTADRLDPLANSQTLARLIPGAKLTLYPDAGHAFLFQDQAAFITLIESFLG
jgi:pimeloyl-ACP methyl ester carboxylesterase